MQPMYTASARTQTIFLTSWIIIFVIVISLPFAITIALGTPKEHEGSQHVGFQTGPGTRSTMGIIWSCLSTIIAAIYLAFRFDFSNPKDNLKSWEIALGKLVWWLTVLAAPEVMLGHAAGEFSIVRANVKSFNLELQGSTASGSSASSINFELKTVSSFVEVLTSHPSCNRPPAPRWTMTHGFYGYMGGFINDRGTPVYPNAIVKRYKHAVIPKLDGYLEDIRDRGKSDPLLTFIIAVQILWFVIRVVGRVASKLPITPLELVTCGYILCACVSYAFWWHKPFSVRTRIHLPPLDEYLPREVLTFPSYEYQWGCTVALIGSLLFAACHLAFWNYSFPTSNAQILWRVCSITAVVLSVCAIASSYVLSNHRHWTNENSPYALFMAITGVTFIISYCAVRLTLVLLLLYSFRSMSMDIYKEVVWSHFLPSIS